MEIVTRGDIFNNPDYTRNRMQNSKIKYLKTLINCRDKTERLNLNHVIRLETLCRTFKEMRGFNEIRRDTEL
jgi:hypothetical protein